MLFSVQYKEKKIINPRSLAVRQAYQERLIQFLGEGNQHNQSALIIHRRFVITRWLVSLIWCSVHSPFVLSARATTPKAWFAAISLSYGSRTIVLWFNQLQFLLSCKERKEVLHLFLFFRDSVTSHPNRRRDCPWSYLIRTPSLSIYKKLLFSDPELLSRKEPSFYSRCTEVGALTRRSWRFLRLSDEYEKRCQECHRGHKVSNSLTYSDRSVNSWGLDQGRSARKLKASGSCLAQSALGTPSFPHIPSYLREQRKGKGIRLSIECDCTYPCFLRSGRIGTLKSHVLVNP